MSRMSAFNSPLLLGFDHIERVLDSVSKSATDGYPPYNIEQVDQDHLRIPLAVAGFSRNELDVTVEDNQLVVRGRQTDTEDGRVFLHRGIAGRQFQRRFVLAEGIIVESAAVENGLLHIDLRRPQPEVRSRRIEIRNGETARRGQMPASSGTIDVEAREA